jgi:hypothetical protein
MVVPKGKPIAPKAVEPALAVAGAGPAARPPAGSNWLANMASSVGLVPLSSDRLARIGPKKKPTPLDDDPGDGKPYELAKPERVSRGPSSKPASRATMLWRHQLGMLEKLFRWINQTAYLLSVPFIMLLLFGAVTRNRHLAALSATVVVVLNIGRLISDFADLAIIPLRDGISWKRLKKPAQRLIEPVFTIGLVVAMFTFLPSLSKGGTGKGSPHREPGVLQKLQERVEQEQATMRALEGKSSDKNIRP